MSLRFVSDFEAGEAETQDLGVSLKKAGYDKVNNSSVP